MNHICVTECIAMHTDDAIYSEQYLSCSFFSSFSIQSDLKEEFITGEATG